MTDHCSVLLTEAKTQMSSPVRERKGMAGGAKVNNKAFRKNSRRRNNSESMFWFCSCFFKLFFCFGIF